MKIIERIYEYIEYKGFKVAEFERRNALSNGYLRKMKERNADVGEGTIVSILENCPDISVSWLILGEGNMLRSNEEICSNKTCGITYMADKISALAEEIGHLKTQIQQLTQPAG